MFNSVCYFKCVSTSDREYLYTSTLNIPLLNTWLRYKPNTKNKVILGNTVPGTLNLSDIQIISNKLVKKQTNKKEKPTKKPTKFLKD